MGLVNCVDKTCVCDHVFQETQRFVKDALAALDPPVIPFEECQVCFHERGFETLEELQDWMLSADGQSRMFGK